jgi:hypothetical protein
MALITAAISWFLPSILFLDKNPVVITEVNSKHDYNKNSTVAKDQPGSSELITASQKQQEHGNTSLVELATTITSLPANTTNDTTFDKNLRHDTKNETDILILKHHQQVQQEEKKVIDLSNGKEYDSFFYIHTPKTGTSMYTVLRNRLSSCKVKDFSCLDILGGGIYPSQSSG